MSWTRPSTHEEIVRRRSFFDILDPCVHGEDIDITKLKFSGVLPVHFEVPLVLAPIGARERIYVMRLRAHKRVTVPASHLCVFREDVRRRASWLDL